MRLAEVVGMSAMRGFRRVVRACIGIFATGGLLVACAIEFAPGTKPMPTPAKLDDPNPYRPTFGTMPNPVPPSPTMGMSVVVGGQRFDAGAMPPPPIPIAVPN